VPPGFALTGGTAQATSSNDAMNFVLRWWMRNPDVWLWN
jgi:hypothetical protein